MPYRRPVPAGPLIAAGLLLATGLLATGALAACSIDIPLDPSSVSAPFSQQPVPSASAGRSGYVCTAAYQTLTGGAAGVADDLGRSGDAGTQAVRDTLTGMAGDLTEEAAGAEDPALAQTLRTIAGRLTAGAAQADPKAYVRGEFQDIGKSLDSVCG